MKTCILALAAALLASPAYCDTLIDHANGVQADANGRIEHFTGLLIGDDGKVLRVLHAGEARPKAAAVVDAAGRTLLPGLIDAHGHVTDLGFYALRLDLTGSSSLADMQQRLRTYAAAHPERKWILGGGWNQELWPDKRFPTTADLDAVVPDRPVVLERVDGHAVVANSAALKAAAVTSVSQSPAGGNIINGLFVDNARTPIDKAIPAPNRQQLDLALAKAPEVLLGFGLTRTVEMS